MTQTLFRNFRMLDPERDELVGGCEILVEGETIREVSERPIRASDAAVIDCGGRTLMPGLIDCHVHVILSEVFIRQLENVPLTLMTARAVVALKAMLERGFTTVRDTGGADWGLKAAVDQGLIEGPRLFISGRAIGPTGGHADARRRTDSGARCGCCHALAFAMATADGEAEVRKVVREERRQGCDQVKIMMSGGVGSPYDPLDTLQFSPGEGAAAAGEPQPSARSATSVGAQVLRKEGKLGCLRADALADLLVVDGNPLKDITVLQSPERSLLAIMKGGRFYRNRLR